MEIMNPSPVSERPATPDIMDQPPPSPGSEFSGSLENMKDTQLSFPSVNDSPQPTLQQAFEKAPSQSFPVRQNTVSTVMLHGIPIVSLVIDNKERLCLAQISNTLLKDFSYNEIHNRRVALGITCVQCTPVQLEILRRAGAMPISSRRCGMITKREAERLVKSFLDDTTPPKLPENFAFNVKHNCGWGCKGSFMPSRYNSSRAKCIKCTYCNMFFSPNKFIFHFHRNHDSKYHHPDAANFNSWRRHLKLDYDNASEDLAYAWEDVKAMFNGGSRKRLLTPSKHMPTNHPHMNPGMKRPRPEMQNSDNMGKIPSLTYPYPVMPMSNMPCSNVPSYVAARPPHPAFPFPASEHPTYATQENAKLSHNFADFWKNKNSPYCNPFGFLWAKNFGIFNDPASLSQYRNVIDLSRSSQKPSPPPEERVLVDERRLNEHVVNDEGHWRSTKCTVQKRKSDSESYFSAFKPVSRDINLAFERRPTVSSSSLIDDKEIQEEKVWSERAQSVISDNSGGMLDGMESLGDPEESDINVTDIDQSELLKPTSDVIDNKVTEKRPRTSSEIGQVSMYNVSPNEGHKAEENRGSSFINDSAKKSTIPDKTTIIEQASLEKVRRLEQFLFRFSKLRN